MPTDVTANLPRKKPNILWWVGGVLLLLLFLFSLQLFGPNPPIIVSPQTTYLTEPLAKNGLPDYERYVLESSRENVTPANNAAVLMWQAFRPGELSPAEFAAVAAEIGMPMIPSKDESLVSPYSEAIKEQINDWLKTQTPSATNDDVEFSEAADLIVQQVMSRPWTSEQIPPLAKWVADNERSLDLLVTAADRPHFYSPSTTLLNKRPDLLIGMLLSSVQATREASRDLSARAMWHLGEGRPMDAWQDIRAIHRLSRLVAQGNTLVEQMVAVAIDGNACDNTQTLVHHGNLSAEQCREILREFSALPRLAGTARSIDRGERLFAVDSVVQLSSGENADLLGAAGYDNDLVGFGILQVVSVDWNIVLRASNEWYDRLLQAAEMPDRATRLAAIATFDADMQRLFAESRSPAKLAASVVSRKQRSELVAATLLGMYMPAISAMFDAEDRANTTYELTRLSIALAVYRAEHGAYPDKLEDLVPSVLDAMPVDIYNAKPFIYKQDGEGYLLYSVGENGADDNASHENNSIFGGRKVEASDGVTIPTGADDISIRLPRSPFELPKSKSPVDEP